MDAELRAYKIPSFAVKLMRALEDQYSSCEFRQKLRHNIKGSLRDPTDVFEVTDIIKRTLLAAVPPKQTRTVNFLLGDENFDMPAFLHQYVKSNKSLVISCKSWPQSRGEVRSFLTKLGKHLSYFGLQDKPVISIGWPQTGPQVRELRKMGVEPDRVILLRSKSDSKACKVDVFDDLKRHFSRAQINEFDLKCLNELSRKVRASVQFTDPCFRGRQRWNPRVCLVGARGSGARLQGKLLARHLDLVFVDAENAVQEWLGAKCGSLETHDLDYLRSAILNERLMQPDCLRHGYVLVGFPQNRRELTFFLKMAVAPNRIVFLDAKKNTCLERKLKQLRDKRCMNERELGSEMGKIEREIDDFRYHVEEMKEVCQELREALEVDANRSIETVKELLWPHVFQSKNI